MARPLKLLKDYGTPEALVEDAERYVKARRAAELPVTLTGMCLHLGCDLDTLKRYEAGQGDRAEFCGAVKQIRLMVQSAYEESGMASRNPAMAIFGLKQLGWTDRQEVQLDLSGDGWGALVDRVRARQRDDSSEG